MSAFRFLKTLKPLLGKRLAEQFEARALLAVH
jgi:hypothetical protein